MYAIVTTDADSPLPINYQEVEAVYNTTIPSNSIQTVAVVGADGGEGVSSMAITLAIRAARAKRQVLLLELNMANPDLAARFGLERQPWTVDIEPEDLPIVKLQNLDIFVLPAPLSTDSDWKFRDPKYLQTLLNHLRGYFEHIIIDCSPVNRRNQQNFPTAIIAGLCQHTLLMLLAGSTHESQLIITKQLLDRHGANLCGSVINDRDNPGLALELCRETYRMGPFFKKTGKALRKWINDSRIINQRI
jgi:Mrp family chromosome partitioning ATPase